MVSVKSVGHYNDLLLTIFAPRPCLEPGSDLVVTWWPFLMRMIGVHATASVFGALAAARGRTSSWLQASAACFRPECGPAPKECL